MNFLKAIFGEFTGFFGFSKLINILKSGNYHELLTYHGIISVLGPLIPCLLIIEIIRAAFYKHFKVIHYKIPFFTYILNAFISRFISLAMVAVCISLFARYAILKRNLHGIGSFKATSFGSSHTLFIISLHIKCDFYGACILPTMRLKP